MFLTLALALVAGILLILGTVAVTEAYNSQLTVTRTFSGQGISSQDNTITVNGLNTTTTSTASTTPAVSKDASFTVTLSSGTATIDLTSITDAPSAGTVTLSGLTILTMKLSNPSTNANNITIAKGASNGFTGFGSAYSETIPPGGEVTRRIATTTVGSSTKTLDVTGTGSQTLNVQVTAG